MQPRAECEALLHHVRWSQLSPLETETLLSSLPHSEAHRETLDQRMESGQEWCGRGWPQQLVLVSSHRARLTIHRYDLQRKSWSVLTARNLPGWRRKIGVTQISEDRIVFTRVNPESPWKPFSVYVYDVWADSWSFPAEDETPGKERGFQPQSVASLEDQVLTVLSLGPQGRLVLCGASRLTSPSPIYTTYGPVPGQTLEDGPEAKVRLVVTGTKVNVVHGQTVSSYDTAGHRWEESPVGGDSRSVAGSSWLALTDGRVLRCGGTSPETGRPVSQCSVYTGGLAAQPLSLGSLTQPRLTASLAQFKGHVFAAGGNRQRCREEPGSLRKGGRTLVEYYVPSTDIWHPLPVQPPVSPRAFVVALLVVNTPLRSLHTQLNNNNITQ